MGTYGNPREKSLGILYKNQKKGCLQRDNILIFNHSEIEKINVKG